MGIQASFRTPMFHMHRLCSDWLESSVLWQASHNVLFRKLSLGLGGQDYSINVVWESWLELDVLRSTFSSELTPRFRKPEIARQTEYHQERKPCCDCGIVRLKSNSFSRTWKSFTCCASPGSCRNLRSSDYWSSVYGHVQGSLCLPCVFFEGSSLQQQPPQSNPWGGTVSSYVDQLADWHFYITKLLCHFYITNPILKFQFMPLLQKKEEAYFVGLLKALESTPGLYFSYDVDLTLK